MGKVAQPRGKIIAKVGHLRIYQKNRQEIKDVEGVKMERTTKTEISIFHGKEMVAGETGFKNKVKAQERAAELMKAHADKPKETK